MIETQDLSLSLKTDKKSFVRTESIILEVSLVNNRSTSIEVEDLIVRNNSLHFSIINKLGKTFLGSLQSPKIRDALKFPPVRKKSMILLQPKTKKVINIDLLNIFGELAEGDYKVKATYTSKSMLFLKSKTLSFKVLKSEPVYSTTVQDYLRVTSHPIRTAWINREADGLYLFIMENSQFLPSSLRSNRRILKIEEIQKVIPSILASRAQNNEHLILVQGDTVRIASLDERVLKDVKTVRLPIASSRILEPTFTDEYGQLYFVVVAKEGDLTVFHLVGYSLEGKIETEQICRFNGDITKYCIIYDEESRLHMAWASDSGDVFCTWFDLEESIKSKGKPKMLLTGKPPILNLQLSKACEDYEGNLQLLLNFVNFESPYELHSHLINVDTQEAVLHSFSLLPELRDLTLLQTILDLECKPHYLFQDRFGALWFKAFQATKVVKVTEKGEIYPRNIDYPVLQVSSDLTRNYGIYLRYVKDMSHFVYKKLESLSSML